MLPISDTSIKRRLSSLHILLIVLGAMTFARLGYLQIVKNGEYRALALAEHQRKYEMPAARGQIYLQDGQTKVPLALNQQLKLLYADPSIIGDKPATAARLAAVTGEPAQKYIEAMQNGKEYAVLKTRVTEEMAGEIRKLDLRGIGMANQSYRTYPEGQLASQVLGFVNNEGNGQYGIEGFLNSELKGQAGLLNAKTDTNGVPIATTDNLSKAPVDGTSVVLTLDRNIQAQAERFLAEGVKKVGAESGSVLVMDPNTGAVRAMASYPSYDPNGYASVKDYQLFRNPIVSDQYEPGSGFKVVTMAAGLDKGGIKADTVYNDSGCETVNGYQVCNSVGRKYGPNTSMTAVLRDSLNTGVMMILRSMGSDPAKITPAAKQTFYRYITDSFRFGRRTGVEQAGEATGSVNKPNSSDVNYANMSFGQGISTTTIQMVQAFSVIATGGRMYKPYLVEEKTGPGGVRVKTKPLLVKDRVISEQAARETAAMMKVAVEQGSGRPARTPGYSIAGKTGTAQIPNPNGKGYIPDKNIGTFVGFAPMEDPKFVIMVKIDKPKTAGFAESTTVPVFANITRWLLQYYAIPPSG